MCIFQRAIYIYAPIYMQICRYILYTQKGNLKIVLQSIFSKFMVVLSKGQNFTLHTSSIVLTTDLIIIASEVPCGVTSTVLKCISFKHIISYGHMFGA